MIDTRANALPRRKTAWLLAVFLILSSLAPVQKYAGTAGVVVYCAVVALIAAFGLRPLARWFSAHVTERQALWLAAATLVVLGAIFAVVYPIADAGVVGGGSDREDNLTEATSELLHGRFPYYVRSYLGLAPDILPGTMILAAPFVLLGDSAYQNLFWLAVFTITARWLLRDGRSALLLLWGLLALAPAVMLEWVTGGELISNALYILVPIVLLVHSVGRPDNRLWQSLGLAAWLGIALSSRVNFILLMPVVGMALVRRAGWRSAVLHTAVVGLAWVLVTVPVYLMDPAGFEPAHLQNRFTQFDSIVPYAGWLLPAVTAAIAVALAFRPNAGEPFTVLESCGLIQLFPIASGHLLTVIQSQALNLSFGVEGWGLFPLFFGALACWPREAATVEAQMRSD